MKAKVRLESGLRFIGENERGQATAFDTTEAGGGTNTAASPMEIMLQAAAACSSMDVLAILRKQRRTITDYRMELEGERRETHPKIFTKVHMLYEITSPDATPREVQRAIELSDEKYCSVSATMKGAGAEITWTAVLINPTDGTRQSISSEIAQANSIVH